MVVVVAVVKCLINLMKSSCDFVVFRRPLHTKDLHHDFIVENIIGDQKVSADSDRDGKMTVVENYSSYATHLLQEIL